MIKLNKVIVCKLMNNICCSLFYVNDFFIGFFVDGYVRIGILILFELNYFLFFLIFFVKKKYY